jgi:hypothetical protein
MELGLGGLRPHESDRRVVVLGFQPRDEKMYPHFREVLEIMSTVAEVAYLDDDDRGLRLADPWLRDYPRSPLASRASLVYLTFCMAGFWRRRLRVRQSIRRLVEGRSATIVAIDHTALNTAGGGLGSNSRVLLWSHDFIGEDCAYFRSPLIRRELRHNRRVIRRAAAIAVQDEDRGRQLDAILKSQPVPKVYVPVAVRDGVGAADTAGGKARERALPRLCLMQLMASPGRGSIELIRAAQGWPDEWSLAFQGYRAREVDECAQTVARRPLFLGVSKSLSEMRANICRADIGVLSYTETNSNHRYLSRACGSLVEFLRLGIPVIVIATTELGRFCETAGCGVSVEAPEQVESATLTIVGRYSEYSRRARETFTLFFDLDREIGPFLDATISPDVRPAQLRRPPE